MKVAIMQPYFFPHWGYFQLINSVDHFVIFDDVNYIKRGWINKNRILQNGLWLGLVVYRKYLFILVYFSIIIYIRSAKIINWGWRGKPLSVITNPDEKHIPTTNCINLYKLSVIQ